MNTSKECHKWYESTKFSNQWEHIAQAAWQAAQSQIKVEIASLVDIWDNSPCPATTIIQKLRQLAAPEGE